MSTLYKFSGRAHTTHVYEPQQEADGSESSIHDRLFGDKIASLELLKNGTFKSVESLSTPVKLETIQCSGTWTKDGTMYKLKVEQVGPLTKAFHDKVTDETVGSVFSFDESEFIKAGEGKILKSLFNQWNMIRNEEEIFSKANAKKAWIIGIIAFLTIVLVYFFMYGENTTAKHVVEEDEKSTKE